MPTERLSMRHIREVLRLRYSVGMSQRAVARSMGCSPFAGTAACILPACGFTTRQAHRGSRDGAEAGDDHLAYADQEH